MSMTNNIGYNATKVEALRDTINTTAQGSANDIVEMLHGSIIVPMSKAWCAPEAVEFFEGLKTTVSSTGEAITAAFDAFRQAVQEAGTSWAENTGGQAPSLAAIDPVELNLNVSDIQPELNGDVFINELEAKNIAQTITEIEQEIKSKMEAQAGKLDAETAFIGRNQSSALQDCFVTVSGEIHKVFKYLTDGEGSLQGQINKAVEKYGQVAEGISSAFSAK